VESAPGNGSTFTCRFPNGAQGGGGTVSGRA